jgi:PAS domain S-box-containing protein
MTDDVRAALNTLITDTSQNGRSLKESIDAVPLAVLVTDDSAAYVMANAAATNLTGYSEAELRKLSVWHLTPDVHEREAETLWRAFRQQREQFGTYRLLLKDGRTAVARYAARANVIPGLHVSVLSEPIR